MIKRSDHVMYQHTMMAPPAAPILREADPTVSFVTCFFPQTSKSYGINLTSKQLRMKIILFLLVQE